MFTFKVSSVCSSLLLKNCRLSQLPSLTNSSTSLNRGFASESHKRHPYFGPYLSRLLRAFESNSKWDSLFRFGRRTRSSVFGSILEKRLVQIFLVDFGRTFTRSRDMLLSATCLSVYNWEQHSISDQELEDYANDLAFISQLTLETLTCKTCHKRLKFDQKAPDISYCACGDGKASLPDLDGWKPFLERPNTLIWRKEHESHKGLYAYKMYGKLDGVTVMDFLRVQLDTEFRKQWDSSATELRIVEENGDTNSDLVYWEMQWPKPFANRDYVFQRRLTYVPQKRVCIISSVAASHPALPVSKSTHRVTEYWSFMVVKPFTEFDKPGMEFVLTYFDNPGLSIPSSVSTWVAMTGLPSFVSKLSVAASKIAGMEVAEPTLLRCLRAQMETHGANIVTMDERRESITVESRGGRPTTVEEETRSVTVMEPVGASSNVEAVSVSQESASSQEASGRVPSAVPATPSALCSGENAQFLSSPVYA